MSEFFDFLINDLTTIWIFPKWFMLLNTVLLWCFGSFSEWFFVTRHLAYKLEKYESGDSNEKLQ